jgi:hypothetical protein
MEKCRKIPRNKKQIAVILKRIEDDKIEKEMKRIKKERIKAGKIFNPLQFKL